MKMAIEFTCLILSCYEHFQTLVQLINRLSCFNASKLCFCSWFVFKTFQIEGSYLFFPGPLQTSSASWRRGFRAFLKEPLLSLISQPVILNHFVEPARNNKCVPGFIARAIIVNTFRNFHQRVNTHYISRTECCRFGSADDRACQGIHFING